jgi:hypothetical protein
MSAALHPVRPHFLESRLQCHESERFMMEMRKMRRHQRWAAFVFLGCVLGVAGCDTTKYLPVTGTVKYEDGTPLKSGTVTFSAAAGNDSKGAPTGIVTDGNFKIVTGAKDGAPVGKWNVTIQGGAPTGMGGAAPNANPTGGTLPPLGGGAPQIAPIFADASKTPLHVEVKDGMDPKQFEFQVTK